MTTAQVVETLVTVNNPIQDWHVDDDTQPTHEMTLGLTPFKLRPFFCANSSFKWT